MMNIGTNPTVNGTTQSIEVNFFDFSNSIYDTQLKIEILERLRDEQKFNSIEDLKIQLGLDMKNSNQFLNQNNA